MIRRAMLVVIAVIVVARSGPFRIDRTHISAMIVVTVVIVRRAMLVVTAVIVVESMPRLVTVPA